MKTIAKTSETSKPVRRIIDEMHNGETREFPIQKMTYIRVICSELKVTRPGKNFMTSLDRKKGVITVTRVG